MSEAGVPVDGKHILFCNTGLLTAGSIRVQLFQELVLFMRFDRQFRSGAGQEEGNADGVA